MSAIVSRDEQFLALNEVAFRLQVSRRTIERQIIAGEFPRPLKVGRVSRFSWPEVVEYLRQKDRQ